MPAPPRRPRAATPRLPTETEASVLRSIVATCALRGVYSLRLNSGAQAIPAADGHARRYVRFGEKGCADLFVLLPPVPDSRAARPLFVEVKRPGKRPDEHQLRWLLARQQAGAVAIWADRAAEFDAVLRHLLAGGDVTLDDDGNIGLEALSGPAERCEHGVTDGEYCGACNAEYKRARAENGVD